MSRSTVQQPIEITALQTPISRTSSVARKLGPAIPYLAVLIGMYVLHSVWISMLGYHLGMVVMLSFGNQWSNLHRLGKGYSSWQLMLAALVGVSTGIVLYLCWPLFITAGGVGDRLARFGLTATIWPFFIGYFVLVNPWLEELSWRQYLATPTKAFTVNDFLFAGYHLLVMIPFVKWPWLLLTLFTLAVTSWVWRQLTRINGGMLVPLVCHLCADAGIVVTAYLFCR